jgi:aminoglycoside 3-N-acetyltransferase I
VQVSYRRVSNGFEGIGSGLVAENFAGARKNPWRRRASAANAASIASSPHIYNPGAVPDYICSRLTPEDLPLFKNLLRVFGEAFGEIATYQDAVPTDEYLRAFLAQPHHIAVASQLEGTIVGGLVAYELMKFERARREVYIYDLAVAADHRRKRVATNLIAELRRIAAARGAYVIFVQADRGDEPAIALYESLGLREEVLHFDIPVP